MISGKALIAGVMGYPVSHSLSPRLHNYWLQQYGIDGMYCPFAVAPERLGEAVKALPALGIKGYNVTIPHKEAVMQYLDEIDPLAERIGAVNTIVVKDGKLHGRNTDAYGFIANLAGFDLKGKQALVLGAGGAAKAVIVALLDAGCAKVMIANRTLAKAEELAVGIAISWEDIPSILPRSDLLVNTTSLGMVGQPALEIDLSPLPVSALVTDIVYNPLMTPLLAQAKQRGNVVVDGIGMLLHQAVPGFEAWFGKRPEVTSGLREHILQGMK